MLAGTPAYLAPELARGSEPGPPSDVFSLGATIYAMTEGEPPFGRSTNDLGLLYKVARGETRPPMRSGPLTPLLTHLLANEPRHRPTATQAAEALDAIAKGATPPPMAATTMLPPSNTPPHGTAVMPASGPGTMPPSGPRTMPPAGPPSGPRTMPPAGPPSGPRTMPPAPEPKKNRTLAVVASILAVLLIAGITYVILDGQKSRDAAGTGPSSSAPTSQVATGGVKTTTANTPTKKPQPTTTQSTPSSQPAKWKNAQVLDFVKQYYAQLPSDPDGALESWREENRPSPYKFKQEWGAYTKVAIKGTPTVAQEQDVFKVIVQLDLTNAETNKTTTAKHVLTVNGKGEKLWITNEDKP